MVLGWFQWEKKLLQKNYPKPDYWLYLNRASPLRRILREMLDKSSAFGRGPPSCVRPAEYFRKFPREASLSRTERIVSSKNRRHQPFRRRWAALSIPNESKRDQDVNSSAMSQRLQHSCRAICQTKPSVFPSNVNKRTEAGA